MKPIPRGGSRAPSLVSLRVLDFKCVSCPSVCWHPHMHCWCISISWIFPIISLILPCAMPLKNHPTPSEWRDALTGTSGVRALLSLLPWWSIYLDLFIDRSIEWVHREEGDVNGRQVHESGQRTSGRTEGSIPGGGSRWQHSQNHIIRPKCK